MTEMPIGVQPEGRTRRGVVLVTEQVKPGGKRSHVETLRAGLQYTAWDASLLDWGHLSWLERAWVAGPMVVLDHLQPALGHRWMVPAFNDRLAAHLRALRWRTDELSIVHVQESASFPAARSAARGLRTVLTVHGPWHREIAMVTGLDLSHPTIRWLRSIESQACLEADAVIAVDHAHADYVRSFGRQDRLWIITNFVDTRQFHDRVPAERFSEDVEDWIGGRAAVFCPRRLVPKNGVPIAIRAISLLRDRGTSCALVIAGYGPQRAEVEALVRELGAEENVRFLGSVAPERMPGLYRRAAAIVVPSVSILGVEEATSISALEGQACARPVIASALGGLREIIQDGVTGLLVPPGDVASLADAIGRVLSDPDLSTKLGQAGATTVREQHSHDAAARQYAAIYDQLCGTALGG